METKKNNIEEIIETKLGKILSVSFGYGGYDDAALGLTITLGIDSGWRTQEFTGIWDSEKIKPPKNGNWTEKDRDETYAHTMRYLSKLLREAKVSSVEKLLNIPVEVKFENNRLHEWRILVEVL